MNPKIIIKYSSLIIRLIVLGLNDTSTLVGHFVSSPREREKRDRRDSWDEREGQGRKRKMNESEDTEEFKHPPSTHTCCKDSRPCPTVSQYQLDALVTQDTQHLCHTRPPPIIIITLSAVRSISILGATNVTQASSKNSDQPAYFCSLISIYCSHENNFDPFVCFEFLTLE